MRRLWIALFGMAALSACRVPPVPDFTYYRLPRPQPLPVDAAPLLRDALVVELFGAGGIYGDQALIYALDPGAQEVRQYHYQLWTDSPPRVLQRRLIELLRDAGVATLVTDELPVSAKAVRVRGTILRFDRVPTAGGGYRAVLGLHMRVDAADGASLLDEYYRSEQPAAGGDLKATVDAYGAALDEIFAKFHQDLRRMSTHAG